MATDLSQRAKLLNSHAFAVRYDDHPSYDLESTVMGSRDAVLYIENDPDRLTEFKTVGGLQVVAAACLILRIRFSLAIGLLDSKGINQEYHYRNLAEKVIAYYMGRVSVDYHDGTRDVFNDCIYKGYENRSLGLSNVQAIEHEIICVKAISSDIEIDIDDPEDIPTNPPEVNNG